MITNPTPAPTTIDAHRQNALDHYDRRRTARTCLGAGCCDWCGRPWESCACGDAEVMPVLAQWLARVAAAQARVQTIRQRSRFALPAIDQKY